MNITQVANEHSLLEVASTTLATFPCDCELWPATLDFRYDLDSVRTSHHA